jgi:UDP-3-O-[3-hydroxymyristoyl] glucosamine N-acyltransferase
MPDPRFFTVAGPFTVAEIAAQTGARIAGAAAPDRLLRDVAPLRTATSDQLSFLENRKYLDDFRRCGAGAVFVHSSLVAQAPADLCLLVSERPYRAYAQAAQAFYRAPEIVGTIAPTAIVDPGARVGAGTRVEHYAVLGPGVEVGRACVVGVGSVIDANCVIGDHVRIGAGVTISHALIGSRVRLFPGVRIGQDGFGFAAEADGVVKVPQLGRVVIGDDVEIGANTTIDRGSGPDTIIGSGTMIDNLVQIGHNVQIGRNCVLVAQVGIAGSVRIGDFVMIGGQVGLAGHIRVGDGARVGAKAGVTKDVPAGETMLGSPAVPIRLHHRQVAALKRLARQKGE